MMTNQEAKLAETLKIWTDHINDCRSSGMTVRAWCKSKGIHVHTYYYRQNQVRKAACKEAQQQERKTSVFAEIKPMEQRR
ncbi:IS66 family insertion sequence element accessory protein TnpA, partial [Dethiosulfovibrio salsuginis]